MRRSLLILACSLLAGCSDPNQITRPAPIQPDRVHVNQYHNVSWLTRHELLMTRHQWERMPLQSEGAWVAGRFGSRPIRLHLLAIAEGVGLQYDWVLLRSEPVLGSLTADLPIEPRYVPIGDDVVVVMSSNVVQDGPSGPAFGIATGRVIQSCDDSDLEEPETLKRPGGSLFHVRLHTGRLYPGSSGSPAAIWSVTEKRWIFLGIVAGGDMKLGADLDTVVPDGRYVTILRPPSWVFDLLTPDEPKITWPDEASQRAP